MHTLTDNMRFTKLILQITKHLILLIPCTKIHIPRLKQAYHNCKAKQNCSTVKLFIQYLYL